MFKSKKQLDTDKTLEEQKKSQAFLTDYKELVKKHHRDFDAVLDFTSKAISARLIVIEYAPPSGIITPENKIVKTSN